MQIAVFDTDQTALKQMRKKLIHFAVKKDRDFDVMWFTEAGMDGKMDKYAGNILIALISLDNENGGEIGDRLYGQNPGCRIFYYSSSSRDLEPFLSARPISFCLWGQEDEVFFNKLEEVFLEVSRARDVFRHQTRRLSLTLPVRDILYLQSDLKYVRIHMADDTSHDIYGKLSEIEKGLNRPFLRIHKSYIVNTMHVRYLDKRERLVYLSDGSRLPVSEAQYENALKYIGV
ncbi:hypothetical protein GPL15_19050 [Clostridium sp. MCC353]|uniref:LytR/AlgR family response regulator transcription factor n=1 Tax=Clostridium sp. MCC353 TaxID=2592646 RepID=UPI001C017049|nr:LytTR family DNA-binding domain-containing protein [Clostridium sp. MCC353]MBT9778599.1 hypothetical protein [Clostridium sp. MCC353]